MNLNNFRVSLIFPGIDLTDQDVLIGNAAISTLTNQSG